jgi:uncharacterized protein
MPGIIRTKLLEILEAKLSTGKAVIMYGPRRVGKTTLLEQYLSKKSQEGKRIRSIKADKYYDRQKYFGDLTNVVARLTEACDLLAIDEAQDIPEMDLIIKNLIDYSEKKIEIILTGSSTIGLTDIVRPFSADRRVSLAVYPPAQFEISSDEDLARKELANRLIYGSYPRIAFHDLSENEKKETLKGIVNDHLFKDVFSFGGIKNSLKIEALARTIAHRSSKEISVDSLANDLKLERIEVERFLDLMEKCFIIFKHDAFSNNQDNVIKKQKKYYFYDLGVRNALLDNFDSLAFRDGDELGKLWENYIVSERKKLHEYFHPFSFKQFFWKTNKNYGEQEIDLVEKFQSGDRNNLYAYEIKLNKSNASTPTQWLKHYPVANFNLINQGNYADFILPVDLPELNF